MKTLSGDMNDKSIDKGQNNLIAFDDAAWDKMESLLNDDDKNPVTPIIISNTLTEDKDGNKSLRPGQD